MKLGRSWRYELTFVALASVLSVAWCADLPALTAQVPVQADKSLPEEKAKASEEQSTQYQDLLASDFQKTWQTFSSDEAGDGSSVWKVMTDEPATDQILVCKGEPKGFLYTTEDFSDFEMHLEWKYPEDANGNSGVLIFTQDEPRIWPSAVQVQLHQPRAGSIFPSGNATTDNTLEDIRELARPINTWNECRIVCRGGRILVDVNGRKAGEVTGAKPAAGRIALQSEGSVVHFRRIRVRRLTEDPPSSVTADDGVKTKEIVPTTPGGTP